MSETQVAPWVRDFYESVAGKCQLEVGARVEHPRDGLVEITSGQFWGTHGVSNFWYWRKVLDSGELSQEEYHGYGWM